MMPSAQPCNFEKFSFPSLDQIISTIPFIQRTILVSILHFLLFPWVSFRHFITLSCFSLWLFTTLVHHLYMWGPSRSAFACDFIFSFCLDLYFSLVWPHYLLFPCFSFWPSLVFSVSYWLFTIPCIMYGSVRLDFTSDRLTPTYYDIQTFYSDRLWPKIGLKHIVHVSNRTVN